MIFDLVLLALFVSFLAARKFTQQQATTWEALSPREQLHELQWVCEGSSLYSVEVCPCGNAYDCVGGAMCGHVVQNWRSPCGTQKVTLRVLSNGQTLLSEKLSNA